MRCMVATIGMLDAASDWALTADELDLAVFPHGAFATSQLTAAAMRNMDVLAVIVDYARRGRCYIAACESIDGDDHALLISPDGEVLLNQPSQSGRPASTSPVPIAVADTPLGMIACLPDEDGRVAEYCRIATLSGAEIILNPRRLYCDEREEADRLSSTSRAWENLAFVVSAAVAADGTNWSTIANYNGQVLCEGPGGKLSAALDMQSLRKRRADPWLNSPAQLRSGLYANAFSDAKHFEPESPDTDGPVYDVLLMQAHQVMLGDLAQRDTVIQQNLQHALGMAGMWCRRPQTRLVVFPEFFLQGSIPQTIDLWEQAGIRIPGPETETLANFARDCNVFVCAAVLEFDPDWPRRYFNTAIIVSPKGEIILRYRKIQCADLNGLLNITTPGNIYSEYVERYGAKALFPVVDTEIGRLAAAICYDNAWPELWRMMALHGAEVVCHPTSEINSQYREAWFAAKRAHAAENMIYIPSANAGSEQFFQGAPTTSMNFGKSALIDFNGCIVSRADAHGVTPQLGTIDLGALRRARSCPNWSAIARFDPQAVGAAYSTLEGFPLDCFAERPMEAASEGPALVTEHIAELQRLGIYRAP